MKYENREQLLLDVAKSIQMQKPFGIEPVFKVTYLKENGFTAQQICKICESSFLDLAFDYEFPLSVVKRKVVFEGDHLFYGNTKYQITGTYNGVLLPYIKLIGKTVESISSQSIMHYNNEWSWNLPETITSPTEIKFNINDDVFVKLTPFGHKIYQDEWDKVFGDHKNFKYVGVTEDKDGWSKWQIWELMSMFGPYLIMGNKLPFQTDIKVMKNG